jgi:Bacteriophage tail sheath protein
MIRLLCSFLWRVLPKRLRGSFCARSYVAHLERSITGATEFAKSQPNGEQLWATVRHTVEDFLFNEWQTGTLSGNSPEQAYHVRCDRTTMTQDDLDNGRLICVVGVAPVKPAEYVLIRIGQWTRDKPDP